MAIEDRAPFGFARERLSSIDWDAFDAMDEEIAASFYGGRIAETTIVRVDDDKLGVVIPDAMLEELGLEDGSNVRIVSDSDNGEIRVFPI